jgi:hypothetical protein
MVRQHTRRNSPLPRTLRQAVSLAVQNDNFFPSKSSHKSSQFPYEKRGPGEPMVGSESMQTRFWWLSVEPTGLAITWDRFRPALTRDAASSLSGFIKSANYSIRVFEDQKFSGSSGFFEIIPSGSPPLSIAGSAEHQVQSRSRVPTTDSSRLTEGKTADMHMQKTQLDSQAAFRLEG